MDTFEFSTDADEMGESELRATLTDLVAKHNKQVEAVEADDTEEELQEQVDQYKEDAEVAVAFFSELLGAQKDMDPELLAEKFRVTELREQIDLDEFSVAAGDEAGDDEDDESTFAEKPEKSDSLPGDDDEHAEYRDDARDALQRLGIAAYDTDE